MGRLKIRNRLKYRLDSQSHTLIARGYSLIRLWIFPVSIALVIVFGVSRVIASPPPTTDELTEYLQNNSLSVGSDVINGYQQIYYLYNDERVFVTDDAFNHTNPSSGHEFIAWVQSIDGTAQIFAYNVLTKASMQVSNYGTNQSPAVDTTGIVWEKWMGDQWQLFYYDGTSIRQLTSGYTSVRPKIKDNQITYVQQLAPNDWQVIAYDLSTDQSQIIKTGNGTVAWPHFKGAEIITSYPDY